MNSPTRALLRKDRPWLLGFLALGGGLGTLIFFESGFSRVFVVPESSFAEYFELLLAPLAVLLALCSVLLDDLQGTRDFLAHRPLTPARLFWTRHLAALAVIASWTAIGLATLWLHEWVSPFGQDGACADPSRLGALGAMTAGLALDYALVAFAFALPTRWFHRAWLAAVLLFSRYAVQSLAGPANPSWLACLAVMAAATFVLLLAAARCESVGHDPDRPTPGRSLAGTLGLTVAAASFFGATALGGWHKLALIGLGSVRPMMGRVGPGELGFLTPPDREGLCTVLGADGSPTDRRVPFEDPMHLAPSPNDPDFDACGIPALFPPFAWYQSKRGSPVRRRVMIREDSLRVVEERPLGRSCWSLPLPPGTARSKGTALIEHKDAEKGATLIELEDGEEEPLFFFVPEVPGLWLVTAETPPRLVARPLPDSECPRRTTWWTDEAGKGHTAIAGNTRTWLYSAGAWKAVGEADSLQESTLTVLDDDALRPEVELSLRDGPTLRHRYGLGRVSEKLFAGWAVVSTILRPTPFALLGAQTDFAAVAEGQDEALLVLDPLLSGGYRWLLVPNLALTAGLMAMMFRDLRRRGASPRRTMGWTLAVFLAGVFSGPLLLVLEPRRAWRRPTSSTPPKALIHSTQAA